MLFFRLSYFPDSFIMLNSCLSLDKKTGILVGYAKKINCDRERSERIKRMVYFNNDNVLLSQAEIDKLIQQMENVKEEKE